ncbi:hypothetical protein Apa02nite_006600 [Actinoplanes palleronii]|uniref:Uncharacterized protein n=1 Tax=Actinoplanes palleronii TaxID=113570 RepID=A0ABQ4B1K0_9ACTN|nr:hypothetical protein Apa02nite_006600 [Actinoplanes palleronii]
MAVDAGRAFHPTFAAVDRGPAGPVPATRRLRDRAVGADVGQVQADHPVVGIQGQFMQLFAQPGLRPPVQAAADRTVRALGGGYPFVAGPVDQSGDDQLEHDPVRDRPAVTTERMARVAPGSLRAQRGELDEDRLKQRRWQSRHGTPSITEHRNSDDRFPCLFAIPDCLPCPDLGHLLAVALIRAEAPATAVIRMVAGVDSLSLLRAGAAR